LDALGEIVLSEQQQKQIFEDARVITHLDSTFWRGSYNGKESTLQQLSPYVGKMKSGMAKALIHLYSEPGDIVLDPFSGSGVVPLEAVLAGRVAWANDLSPYAYVLTKGKLETPADEQVALENAHAIIEEVEKQARSVNLDMIPKWVKEFYHPGTLREIIVAFRLLKEQEDYFLMSCLLGILHHVRPGFLSYPASHLVPYLRTSKYPPDVFPKMYDYRDLRSRFLAKIKRAYRRTKFPLFWNERKYQVWQVNTMDLPIESEKVDAMISSPPYFGALDYARDNRLRLWFLGFEDWKELDNKLTANNKVYLPQMSKCIQEMGRVLKKGGYCVLVLGDVEGDGKTRRTAEILADIAVNLPDDRFKLETIYDDKVPDERRSRRRTRTTKYERILVMKKL